MRRTIDIGTRHLYAMYRKKHRLDKEFPPVDYNTYRKVLKRFGDNFIKRIVANREGVDFLSDRGFMVITKSKSSVKPLIRKDGSIEHLGHLKKDWSVRMDDGLAPPMLNDHSDGYKFKWNWNRKNCKVQHRTMVSFDIIRRWDRYLAKSIFAGKQDYYTK